MHGQRNIKKKNHVIAEIPWEAYSCLAGQ